MGRPKHIKETRFEYLKRTIQEHLAGPKRDECLRWPFAVNGDGYGIVAWAPSPDFPNAKTSAKTYRLAYFLTYGSWPEPLGMHICKVVTKNCYNPLHIVPGTDAQNAQDREDRGRGNQPKGEAQACAKLTEDMVFQIRQESAFSSQRTLAQKFGVSRRTIHRVLRGSHWKEVPMPMETRVQHPELAIRRGESNGGGGKLKANDVVNIRSSKLPTKELAAMYGVSIVMICNVISRRSWKHIP